MPDISFIPCLDSSGFVRCPVLHCNTSVKFLSNSNHTSIRPYLSLKKSHRFHRALTSSSTEHHNDGNVQYTKDTKVILGINQYSHDVSVAIVDANTGSLLYASSKERHSRKKHDGGSAATAVRAALDYLRLQPSSILFTVANNHHFPVIPFEATLPFASAIGYIPKDYDSKWNLLPSILKYEISHHLAHAWSVIPFTDFDTGFALIMDGMGESYHDMYRRHHLAESIHSDIQISPGNLIYQSDANLPYASNAMMHHTIFGRSPDNPLPWMKYREAETLYRFNKSKDRANVLVEKVFKRWTPENSPSELYNHGFENMESLGAIYSRISSHIFGNWNTCGKVMGLAPYISSDEQAQALFPKMPQIITGSLADKLSINWTFLTTLPHVNEWSSSTNFPFYVALAARVQQDLEDIVLPFVKKIKKSSPDISHICLAGGVFLNSTLNGKIMKQALFKKVFIPPCPGDDGIAVGCAMYGYYNAPVLLDSRKHSKPYQLFSPYLGRSFDNRAIEMALFDFDNWIHVSHFEYDQDTIERAAAMIAQGRVVAWFHGRSEYGPRALGNRSLLADPRNKDLVDLINLVIKKREKFRPFAPTVLEEFIDHYFEFPEASPNSSKSVQGNISPYMSITLDIKPYVREKIPAVTHIDGTARLQTLRYEDNPRYYKLIQKFAEITGIHIVLNTSFNIAGEPIVETPSQALRSFLDGFIDHLVFDNHIVSKKEPHIESGTRFVCESIFRSETVMNNAGQIVRVYVYTGEKETVVKLKNVIELRILEKAFGNPMTMTELSSALEKDGSLSAADAIDLESTLLSLWRKRLIHLLDPDP